MFPAPFFYSGGQPRFATCLSERSKDGGTVRQHSLGTLLVQLLVCLTVFFPSGNSHKSANRKFTKTKFLIDIQNQRQSAKMQCHSTPPTIMTAQEEPPDLSKLECSIIKPDKIQHPIKWFQHQFNQLCDLELNRQQVAKLLSADKQRFVSDIPKQLQTLIRNHMSDVLIDHHTNQQLECIQTADLQPIVNAMSFTHLNNLKRWTSLRNPDQFKAFAKHSMASATIATSLISGCPSNNCFARLRLAPT